MTFAVAFHGEVEIPDRLARKHKITRQQWREVVASLVIAIAGTEANQGFDECAVPDELIDSKELKHLPVSGEWRVLGLLAEDE